MALFLLVWFNFVLVSAEEARTNPLSKVLDLLTQLEGRINSDKDVEAKAYNQYFEWCDDTSKNTGFAIDTYEKQTAELNAKIAQLISDISAGTSKIEELGASVAQDESEQKDATSIREKEAADFASSEAELMQAIDTLSRAVGILEKEMAKNPASFAQLNTESSSRALQALSAVLDAASFMGSDQKKLLALVQSRQSDDADGLDFGAPAADTYKTHSNGILDVLEDLKEKAEGQLSDLRKAEVNAKHNYDMLRQSLTDQISSDSKDMADEKAGKAAAQQAKATAEGDLTVTTRELSDSRNQLATAKGTCMQVAAAHEETVAARQEELRVLAQAKKMLVDTTTGAASQSYSFLQTATGSLSGLRMRTRSDLAGSEVVVAIKRLAKQSHSAALAQLASRIATVLRYSSSSGEDPFSKVKGLIQDMIAKLEKEAGMEATEKAYCDEQIAKTEAKKSDLNEDIAKMTSRIDKAAATSAQLKQHIQQLEAELAMLAKEQAQMDSMRQEGHAEYAQAKADFELGLSGVRQALGVLRDYYGSASMLQDDSKFGAFMQQPAMPEKHSQSSGAGNSVINMLEVIESDFATGLAKEESEEADSQAEYEKITQENAVTRTIKQDDIKYKTQESKYLDTTAAEYSGDRETARTELEAVLEYYSKINSRCIAKPETYESRKARRQAEIKGLKEALSILEDETALVQRKRRSGYFRGSLAAQ